MSELITRGHKFCPDCGELVFSLRAQSSRKNERHIKSPFIWCRQCDVVFRGIVE